MKGKALIFDVLARFVFGLVSEVNMQIGEIRSHESMHKPESEKSSQVQRMPKQLDTPALKAWMKRGGVASSDEMQGDLHSYVVTMFPDSQLAENVPINFAL